MFLQRTNLIFCCYYIQMYKSVKNINLTNRKINQDENVHRFAFSERGTFGQRKREKNVKRERERERQRDKEREIEKEIDREREQQII